MDIHKSNFKIKSNNLNAIKPFKRKEQEARLKTNQ